MSDAPSTDVGEEAILTVFARRDEDRLRPPEVAEDLPAPVEDLRDDIENLSEQGLLVRDADRQSGTTYSLTPEGQERADVPESELATDVEAQATATGTQSTPRDQETAATPPAEPGESESNPPYEVPESDVEAFDPPGTPAEQTRRRSALRAAYKYLRDRGSADRADFVEDVYDRAPAGYDDPDDWWNEVVEPGLGHLDGAEPGEGATDEEPPAEWVFDEDAAVRGREA